MERRLRINTKTREKVILGVEEAGHFVTLANKKEATFLRINDNNVFKLLKNELIQYAEFDDNAGTIKLNEGYYFRLTPANTLYVFTRVRVFASVSVL